MINFEMFQTFCNENGKGYLKTWKANSILGVVGLMPGMLDDSVRLFDYLKGCLMMEGFTEDDCDVFARFIIAKRDELFIEETSNG